jgi:putative peptide maturation system protein
MTEALEQALADALALLRELPRHRHGERPARARFEQFKASHPGLPCRLLIEARPGSDDLDYDILLTIAGAGAVALSWHPDHGIPWTARYADHWAANFVLTINGRSTTIQSALLYLSARLQRRPDLMRDLVDRALFFAAIEDAPPEIGEAELEAAVDTFRARQRLYSGAAMQQWLDDMQLTMETLQELVAQSLQLEKFKNTLVADQLRPHFDAHRRDFDRLTVMRLETMMRASARRVAATWRRSGTCPVLDGRQAPPRDASGRLETFFACDLPAAFAGAKEGSVIGPVDGGGTFWVGQVLGRHAARYDGATRERIQDLIIDAWLTGQRSKATIRWHWV